MGSNIYTSFAAENSVKPTKQSTPQTQAIPGREAEMARNNAGGFSFTLGDWGVLDRFLMIGSESAGYYVGAKETTKLSFDTLKKCIAEDGVRVVNRIVEYSVAGRAPKNDPAVVALAVTAVYGNQETVQAAYGALSQVARTGTHLFLFVSILNDLGKWNAAAKRGVSAWYNGKRDDKLAVQLLKYQSRNGWSHRDVLRLAHVKAGTPAQNALFRLAVKGELTDEAGVILPRLVEDFLTLKGNTDKRKVLSIIEQNDQVSWEMIPTEFMKDKDILFALVKNMGMTALIRKLGSLSAHGVIDPLSEGAKLVNSKLADTEALVRGRVHPVTILQAMKQYAQGRGEKGSLVWTPNQFIVSTLDDAFYASFGTIEKTNESYLLGVDISGSMTGAMVNGSPNLRACDVAAVMAMAIARNQPNSHIVGFNQKIKELKINSKMRLDQALGEMRNWDGGGTDCAKLFEYAKQKGMHVDKFVSITDNETWAGNQAPVQALKKYRAAKNQNAKSVVIGTSVSNFTIADPKDAGMLDIAGFDSAAPQIIAML
jgi:60 kDa SS-A/Ro ribonucleoprotein